MIETVSLTFIVEMTILFAGFVAWISMVAYGMNAIERRLNPSDVLEAQESKAAEQAVEL